MCGKRVQTVQEEGTCWCDYLCTRVGDCCSDFKEVCQDYLLEEGDQTLYMWRLEFVELDRRLRDMLNDQKNIPEHMIKEIEVFSERDALSERIAIKDHIDRAVNKE